MRRKLMINIEVTTEMTPGEVASLLNAALEHADVTVDDIRVKPVSLHVTQLGPNGLPVKPSALPRFWMGR